MEPVCSAPMVKLIKSCICVDVPCLFRHIMRTGRGGNLKLVRITLSLLSVIPFVVRHDNICAGFNLRYVVAIVVRPDAIIKCGLGCMSSGRFRLRNGYVCNRLTVDAVMIGVLSRLRGRRGWLRARRQFGEV